MMIDLDQAGNDRTVLHSQPLGLALGFFDGVHLGHRALMEACVDQCGQDGSTPAALLLEPHPLNVLGPRSQAVRVLNTVEEKAHLIRQCGIQQVFLKSFDEDFAKLSPEAFIQQYLMALFHIRHVVAGFNYSFGQKGAGTPEFLRRYGQRHGFQARIVEPVYVDGILVSSTLVRNKIAAGEMEAAARFLGHPHYYAGKVVLGKQIGRELGFPTANIRLDPSLLLPAFGVYAAEVEMEDQRRCRAVVNVGLRPTVRRHQGTLALEAHLLDFSGDLYGQYLRVFMLKHIRTERHFENLHVLRAQVGRDIETVRGMS
jgi:riboflavin kinase/FMN adenylyltransferase